MLEKGQDIELHIDRLGLDGMAVGRHDGLVCFVRNAVPGETVRATVARTRRKHVEAEAVEILAPCDKRVQPRCRHFGTCGGCVWQHVAYDMQLREKQQFVVDAFERIGGFSGIQVLPIIGSGDEYFYRNKMEFSFSRQRWLTTEELRTGGEIEKRFGLGLHVPRRYDKVLDIEECLLQSELSNAILNAVREFCRAKQFTIYSTETHDGYLRHLVIRQGVRTSDVMVNLVTTTDEPDVMRELSHVLVNRIPQITTFVNNITARKSMVAVGDSEKVYHGPGYIEERLGKYAFRISANSFFQTNTKQAERLYGVARAMAELAPSDILFDLYCGTGTIALFLSDAVREVVGIDSVESAIDDARRNAQINNVGNCRFFLGDLKERLTKDTAWLTGHPDVIVVDPPRSGLHPKVVEQIAKLNPDRIVYVSCNPATQARDARMFTTAGYELSRLQPVDMFPHTSHVENVASFQKVQKST